MAVLHGPKVRPDARRSDTRVDFASNCQIGDLLGLLGPGSGDLPVSARLFRPSRIKPSGIPLSRDGKATSVRAVLEASLRAHAADDDRIALEGPNVTLPADLSLLTHELATEEGRVSVEWTVKDARVAFRWTEADGPRLDVPSRKGFGSVLTERAFPSKVRAVA